jgi:hypothetical protein
MDESFKKCILNCLIDLGGVTKIVIRDPSDSIPIGVYELFETAACFLMIP